MLCKKPADAAGRLNVSSLSMTPADRLIVAIDRSSREDILRLAGQLRGVCGLVKIGLQAFVSNGPSIVRDLIGEGHRVFLDLKFHDIPNTVSHAVSETAALKASMITIHSKGGRAMCAAASKAAFNATSKPLVLGVTVLTSLGLGDLQQLGIEESVETQVVRLAELGRTSGLDGVVASPQEIEAIRNACGSSFLIVTPGIRGRTDESGDQKRTRTAGEAIRAGADYIVVGRPVTSAEDPRHAASEITEEIADAV